MPIDLSYLDAFNTALAQVPHLLQAQQQTQDQQDQLAETKRHNQADEAVAGRHADIAADQSRRAQSAQDFTQAGTIAKDGWQPLAKGDDGSTYDPSSGAPVPGAVGVTQGMTTPYAGPSAQVGGQTYRPQTKAEALAAHQDEIRQRVADLQVEQAGNPQMQPYTDQHADWLGIPRGGKMLPLHLEQLTNAHQTFVGKDAPPVKPPGNWSTNQVNGKLSYSEMQPDGTLKTTSTAPGIGNVRAPAAAGGDGGEKPLTSQERIGITNTYVNGMKDSEKQMNADREKAQSDKVKALSDAAQIKDPAAKAAAVKAAYDSFNGALDGAAAQHKGRLSNLSAAYTTNGRLPAQAWADNMPDKAPTGAAVATPGRGGSPAGAAPGAATPKVATMDDVNAYAKKNGVSQAQAIKAAQAKGYKIGTVQ